MPSPHVWLKAAIEDAASGIEAWPVEMTGGGDPPYVIYTRTNTVREQVLSDTLDETPEPDYVPPVAAFTVVVYADSYVEGWEIADAIVERIHRFKGSGSGWTIHHCLVLDVRDAEAGFLEGRETPTYTIEITAEIRWE